MSDSTFTSFAVAGAGTYGSDVVKFIASHPGTSVRILSRSADKPAPDGVRVIAVDYESAESLENALEGVQVVVNTLSARTGKNDVYQRTLIDAAKKQGVNLFVPNEFGGDVINRIPDGPMAFHWETLQYLREIKLPYLVFMNGIWTDYCLNAFFKLDWKNKKAIIAGDGNMPLSFTFHADSAQFLSHVLTTLPPSALTNAEMRIQGDCKTYNEAIRIYEETHPGTKIDVSYESLEAVQERIGPNPGGNQMLDYLRLSWGRGDVNFGKASAGLSNDLWKEWKPRSVKDYLLTL